jgi:hypothetical protein
MDCLLLQHLKETFCHLDQVGTELILLIIFGSGLQPYQSHAVCSLNWESQGTEALLLCKLSGGVRVVPML